MNPSDLLGQRIAAFAWVPIDDEYCMSWAIILQPANRDINATGIGGLVRGLQTLRGPQGEAPIIGGLRDATSGWNGRFRPVANIGNDFLIDRQAQRTMTIYSGIPSDAQAPAVQESMGPIYDRTGEHLATTDSMIIRSRRRLIDAAKPLRAEGTIPLGVDEPALPDAFGRRHIAQRRHRTRVAAARDPRPKRDARNTGRGRLNTQPGSEPSKDLHRSQNAAFGWCPPDEVRGQQDVLHVSPAISRNLDS